MNTKNNFKTRLKNLTIIFFLVFIVSCKNGSKHSFKEEISIESNDVKSENNALSYKNDIVDNDKTVKNDLKSLTNDLKIIKTANVKFKVANVHNATKIVKKIVANYEGYISNMKYNNDNYRKENSFSVKIPRNNFDLALDSIASISEFTDFIEISAKDVTEEYLDIETRLKTKLEVKTRYEEILRKNAKTVKEILETEEKLRIIQEEIEAAQGKLKYMNNRVAFSTIKVSIYETVAYKDKPTVYKRTFGSEIKEALLFGWNIVKSIFLLMFYVWPIIIVLLILVYYFKIKKMRKKKS